MYISFMISLRSQNYCIYEQNLPLHLFSAATTTGQMIVKRLIKITSQTVHTSQESYPRQRQQNRTVSVKNYPMKAVRPKFITIFVPIGNTVLHCYTQEKNEHRNKKCGSSSSSNCHTFLVSATVFAKTGGLQQGT